MMKLVKPEMVIKTTVEPGYAEFRECSSGDRPAQMYHPLPDFADCGFECHPVSAPLAVRGLASRVFS